MQATPILETGFKPDSSSRIDRRVAAITGVVIGLHVIALAIAFTVREVRAPLPVESKTITAELLPPPTPAAPVAIGSAAPPPPKPVPVQKVKPKVQPHPAPKPTPTPTPMPVAQAPSQHEISAPPDPTPAPPAPAAPAAPPAPAAKPVMSISAPKDASHLSCSIVEPTYPTLSKRRGETGRAVVQFILAASGKIENIELKKSSGYDRLDQAALDAIRSSSCKPYLVDGEATRVPAVQPFDFSLNN